MEQQAVSALSKILLTPQNLGVMISSWFLISLFRKVFPLLFQKSIMQRLLPVFPVLLCCLLIWLPGVAPKDFSWGEILLLGVMLGWGSGYLHKFLKQTVLGKDLFTDDFTKKAE